ncbi:MAG: NAD-dependent DNA ligase LigA [Ignavibacteriae bacterium]|nr:MAG: NAD-dependent DNA ligase LigA [Ignavibacteriota bacterium]
MAEKAILKRIKELREKLLDADYKYYVLAQPDITDLEYDMYMNELLELEKQYPELVTTDSPSQRVGGQITNEFPSVVHEVPMLSLSNSYDENDLLEFDKRIKNLLKGEKYRYVCELKFDGAAVSLLYEKGELIQGATRGDGFRGDKITTNLKTIRSIPLKLDIKSIFNTLDIEVRGEVFIKKDDFIKINERQETEGDKLYANARNTCAGTLKLKDSSIVASRNLNMFCYNLRHRNPDEQKKLKSHFENLNILKKLKFPVNDKFTLKTSIEDVIKFCGEVDEYRESLPYEIDGVVVKVDSLEQQEKIGSIAKSPRWAIAYKFRAKQAETRLYKITLQVGRVGTITPVAELDPIFLAGSTISRATLHNADEIKRKDIREGDYVIIEKGGDVIPKVVEVLKNRRPKPVHPEFKMPDSCPVCNSLLVRPEGEANYFCINFLCPAQVQARIEHFVARNAMDIEGLGYSIIERFIKDGYLKDITDIYGLPKHEKELKVLERFGEKSIDNIFKGIERSKERPFEKVLFAIGIRHVGDRTARILARHFRNIDNLCNVSREEIEHVHEIGPKIAESVYEFFGKKNNRILLDRLKKAGLQFEVTGEEPKANKFTGLTFVLTGTLEKYKRDDAKKIIEDFGGTVSASVSKKTDFVLAGSEAGSKLVKASKLGVKIISEQEFEEMIKV